MAAKRNKSQAKRNGGSSAQSLPGWAWLVLGLVLGIGLFLLAPKFLGSGDGFFRPQPNADAKPPALDATDRDKEPLVDDTDSANTGKDPKGDTPAEEQDYAFYNLLSGEETPISDAELAAKTRAEEARAAQVARDAADAADRKESNDATRDATPANTNNPDAADTANRDTSNPSTKPPAAIDAVETPQTTANTPRETPRNTTAASADTRDARYLLQAGAFAASGDAEALKAKIAFLGLSARVESAEIKGNTVYRVRMGPYGTATDLADAKRKLAGGGLPAMAIKVK
jgi:cell division protein FtsN